MAEREKSTFAMSKRRRAAILVLCVLAAFVFIWLDHSHIRRSRQARPQSEEKAKAYDFEKYHKQTFAVTNVVDGDTIDIDVPDGRYDYTRIRLLGIDSPETKHPEFGVMYFGKEVADFATNLVLGKSVAVYLEEERTRGYYGRLLAYVKLPDGGFLNEVLLSEGFAYADLRFKHSFYNKYKQLEATARSQKKGLWKEVSREQLPEWLQKRKPKLLSITTPQEKR